VDVRTPRRGRPVALRRLLLGLLAVAAAILATAPGALAQDLRRPDSQTQPPPFHELSAREAISIADRDPDVREQRARHGSLYAVPYTRGRGLWQVSYFAGGIERVQVVVHDRARRVIESWTGHQVRWRMARGYEGAFGRKLNAPYVWIPLCLLFLLPFVDPRRPFRLLHLDLVALLAFSVSHLWFNWAQIGVSVPLVYPVLAYLLVRMLAVGLRGHGSPGPLLPLVPVAAVAFGLVFLVGFRVALNVTDSKVIDVGQSSVVGADRIADGDELYGEAFTRDDRHGDTYGPVTYLLYVPFEQLFPWDGGPEPRAAHAAAIAFDLLTLLGLLVLGRRLRAGPPGWTLGVALAYAWTANPYSLFVMQSNANDTAVAMLLVWTLVALGSPAGRGALGALAAATKFSPAAVLPLLARGASRPASLPGAPPSSPPASPPGAPPPSPPASPPGAAPPSPPASPPGAASPFGARGFALFAAVGLAVTAAVFLPLLPDGGFREVYDRTVGFQLARESPFSVWGQEESLAPLHTALKVLAAALAVAVAFVPRQRSPTQVAALAGAVVIAVQLVVTHWFYLYVVWFLPLVLVALLAPRAVRREALGPGLGLDARGVDDLRQQPVPPR
jgi:hypothetical protein